MLFRIDALRNVDAFLEAHGVPYAVIGGIANAVRGEPRATHDADLKVLVKGMTIAKFRALAEAQFKPHRRSWLVRAESALARQTGRSLHSQLADAVRRGVGEAGAAHAIRGNQETSRQVESRQVESRQVESRQVESRQVESRQVESRQVESR